MKSINYKGVTYYDCKMNRPCPPPIFDGAHGYAGWERSEYEIDLAKHNETVKKFEEHLATLSTTKPISNWTDALPKHTDKCEAKIISASTLNEDGTETEYYNRERDGHKELSELLPTLPDELSQLTEPTQEQEIERLQEALLFQNKKIVQLTEENKRLKEQLFGNINQPNY